MLIEGVTLIEVRQAGLLFTTSEKGLVDVTLAKITLKVLEENSLVSHGFEVSHKAFIVRVYLLNGGHV